MGKTIIVSNRLPVRFTLVKGKIVMHDSEGGLATGLSAIHQNENNLWIGWPGLVIAAHDQKPTVLELEKKRLIPVFLSEEEIKGFYEGFSNEILWPIFHYISTYSNYDTTYWKQYIQVNKKFRDEILVHAEPNDTIWIHDYQLLLLPMMIREALPEITIAFFQHIPFPSQELFRLIPWRNELLTGMLGADLLGFQTYDDVRHFISASTRILGAHHATKWLEFEGRNITVDSFPISMDYEKFDQLARDPGVKEKKILIQEAFNGQQIMLSIDRLDYSKGILQRLMAYVFFLEEHPEFFKKVVLYMIVVPSRDSVPQYEKLKNQIDQEVGRINAKYGSYDWQPIAYFYQSFPIEELSALYSAADVCLVTSMRDGMNLVCKEYVASRIEDDGVLILSELAGASHELVDAIIVNPTHLQEMAQAMENALNISESEMNYRMKSLRQVVNNFDIHYWAASFMDRLTEIKAEQTLLHTKRLNSSILETIFQSYKQAKNRLLLLDYDGTLVGFHKEATQAIPDEELYAILDALVEDPNNTLVLISGRKHEHLEEWFGDKRYGMIAEHGVWSKQEGGEWELRPGLVTHWQEDIHHLLQTFVNRTPGTSIEQKSHSIAWHYRKAQKDLGMIRSNELLESLRDYSSKYGLQILEGNKVIEVRNAEVNKGRSVLELLENHPYDFIFSIGDDRTDEDVFQILPKDAYSVKVGGGQSSARFFVNSHLDVRKLLLQLIKSAESSSFVKK